MEPKKPSHKRLEDLSRIHRSYALDCFIGLVREHLTTKTYAEDHARLVLTELERLVNERLEEDGETPNFNAITKHYQMAALVTECLQRNLLRVVPRVRLDLEKKLQEAFELSGATVTGSRWFWEVAAGRFVEQLRRIIKIKEIAAAGERVLNIGIVSGTTVRSVIDWLFESKDWSKDFQDSFSKLDRINVMALNVSLTRPEHLGGNATVLALRLAHALEKNGADPSKVKPYGISASLFVAKDKLKDEDSSPEVRKVLEITQPGRANNEVKGPITHLDIILTGVGERPIPGGTAEQSIFFELLMQNDPSAGAIITAKQIVGDLAFMPIQADGEKAELEHQFYSAIDEQVLLSMAKDPNKTVMLVANSRKNKVPIIYAVSGGAMAHSGPRYISHLCVDEDTATTLLLGDLDFSDVKIVHHKSASPVAAKPEADATMVPLVIEKTKPTLNGGGKEKKRSK